MINLKKAGLSDRVIEEMAQTEARQTNLEHARQAYKKAKVFESINNFADARTWASECADDAPPQSLISAKCSELLRALDFLAMVPDPAVKREGLARVVAPPEELKIAAGRSRHLRLDIKIANTANSNPRVVRANVDRTTNEIIFFGVRVGTARYIIYDRRNPARGHEIVIHVVQGGPKRIPD